MTSSPTSEQVELLLVVNNHLRIIANDIDTMTSFITLKARTPEDRLFAKTIADKTLADFMILTEELLKLAGVNGTTAKDMINRAKDAT